MFVNSLFLQGTKTHFQKKITNTKSFKNNMKMDKLLKRLPTHKKICLQYLYKAILKMNSFFDVS